MSCNLVCFRAVNHELIWNDLNLTYLSDWWFNELYDSVKELDISYNKVWPQPSGVLD